MRWGGDGDIRLNGRWEGSEVLQLQQPLLYSLLLLLMDG